MKLNQPHHTHCFDDFKTILLTIPNLTHKKQEWVMPIEQYRQLLLKKLPIFTQVPTTTQKTWYHWHPKHGMYIDTETSIHYVTHEYCHWLLANYYRHQYKEYRLGPSPIFGNDAPLKISKEAAYHEEIMVLMLEYLIHYYLSAQCLSEEKRFGWLAYTVDDYQMDDLEEEEILGLLEDLELTLQKRKQLSLERLLAPMV